MRNRSDTEIQIHEKTLLIRKINKIYVGICCKRLICSDLNQKERKIIYYQCILKRKVSANQTQYLYQFTQFFYSILRYWLQFLVIELTHSIHNIWFWSFYDGILISVNKSTFKNVLVTVFVYVKAHKNVNVGVF